jgi:hypothetical protein
MIMTDRQSVAANATVQNSLAGKQGEFCTMASLVSLFASASAVGLNMTLQIGGEVVIDDQEVNAQNRMPLVPDDFVGQGGGLPSDRIILRYRNTTGGAITAFSRVEVTPA